MADGLWLPRGEREPLPNRRTAETIKANVGGQTIYTQPGLYPDGRVGEVFIRVSRQGSLVRSLYEAFAISTSMGLQYGAPLEAFVERFTGTMFDPSGLVMGHDRIKQTTSMLDYIFRELAITHLERDDLAD